MRPHKQSSKASNKSKTHFKSFTNTDKYHHLEWTNQITESPVYHPSLEDFKDPFQYLQKIAAQASKYG